MDQVGDIWGDTWDVAERRPAPAYGLEVVLGWPAGMPRGAGRAGGKRVVITPELGALLTAHRTSPGDLVLPIGMTALKRLRRLMGHNRYLDSAAWWEARIDDLSTLTSPEFAARHGVDPHTAAVARLRLCGSKLRPAGWWLTPEVKAVLAAPTAQAADELGISAGGVRRLRVQVSLAESSGCLVAGCSDKVWAKGLCKRHYHYLRKHGIPAASAHNLSRRQYTPGGSDLYRPYTLKVTEQFKAAIRDRAGALNVKPGRLTTSIITNALLAPERITPVVRDRWDEKGLIAVTLTYSATIEQRQQMREIAIARKVPVSAVARGILERGARMPVAELLGLLA